MSTVTSPEKPRAAGEAETSRHARWPVIVSAVVAVVPIFVAAIRDGLYGWTPTLDAASTVLRSRSVFSSRPPLIGMWSAASTWAGQTIHFPGALQLYLLAVPIKLFGNSWGTLLGMAVLNSVWILLAGWLIYRKLGARGATVAFSFLALFAWSLGSEILVDVVPMQMVTVPFMLFLVAVWAVADGDLVAMPVLIFIANYLLLDHLVLTFLVPVIGLCAPVGLALWIRRERRTDPDGHPTRVRRLKRHLLWALLMTFVLWIPPLIDEIFSSHGNLSALLDSAGNQRPGSSTYPVAIKVAVRILGRPWFWFRPTYRTNQFGYGNPDMIDIVLGLTILVVLGVLGTLAYRRRDHTSMGLLAVAVVAIAASIENIVQAPGSFGFPINYLRSLWGMAMFVWLAVFVSIFRLTKGRLNRAMAQGALVVTLVAAAATLPSSDMGSGTLLTTTPPARQMISEVIPKLEGRGKVLVLADPTFIASTYYTSLLLTLDTAGIPYCVKPSSAGVHGPRHNCSDSADVGVHVAVRGSRPPESETLLAKVPLVPDHFFAEYRKLDEEVVTWLGSRRSVALTDSARDLLESQYPADFPKLEKLLEPSDGDVSGLARSATFITIITGLGHVDRNGRATSPIKDSPLAAAKVLRWAELTNKINNGGILWVYEFPVTAQR